MPRPPKDPTNPVRVIRTATGLTQPKFAELVGTSAITIQKVENGGLALSRELAGKIALMFPKDSLRLGVITRAEISENVERYRLLFQEWQRIDNSVMAQDVINRIY